MNSPGETMSIQIRSFAFTEALISAAPDTSGVYALWQNGGVIYLGKASAGGQTIRKALDGQFQGRRWNDSDVTRVMRSTSLSFHLRPSNCWPSALRMVASPAEALPR